MKLAFIGGGNMASALIGGLIAKGAKPGALSVVEPVAAARGASSPRSYRVHASAAPDARTAAADTLVLAVKPQDMRAAAAPLAGRAARQTGHQRRRRHPSQGSLALARRAREAHPLHAQHAGAHRRRDRRAVRAARQRAPRRNAAPSASSARSARSSG